MPDDRGRYANVPIPSYDEAVASAERQGRRQGGDEIERHTLLAGAISLPRHGAANYQSPAVESGRTSYESTFTSPRVSEEEDLRRDIEQMNVEEPGSSTGRRMPRLRLPKRFVQLRETLSAISLPHLPSRLSVIERLRSRMPPIPAHLEVSWPIIARLIGLFVIISIVYGLVALRVLGVEQRIMSQHYLPESVRAFVQGHIDPRNIERYLYEMSFDDHIAGTKGDFFLAQKVEHYFMDARLDAVANENYEVYLNYPRAGGRRVAIIDPPDLAWEAKLEEEIVESKHEQHQSAVFHGHSKSDNVTGHLIYANYGSREDFAKLDKAGIDVTGAIVLVRYYGTQGDRALKVKAAELAGAAGCLIYSDPAEDGSAQGEVWPNGPWRPEDSVQRGAVSLMSWVVGDVLTPGWASTSGANRLSVEESQGLVKIPSLPLAWRDGRQLLHALIGHGNVVEDDWKGGDGSFEWWTGDKTSPIVHLQNLQDENEKQPIRNVLGKIQGVETPDKTVYVGNHRDAWCFGAVDPGTGTAILLEIVRVFGELMQLGWRPRRSIVFASWDGEEYNLIGSTEHVEERIDLLRKHGVAYLNVDIGVSGDQFWVDASPVFKRQLVRVLHRVSHPHQNKTLLDTWAENGSRIGGLGAGSDYVAFQDLAGCSSIDFGFSGKAHAYPYHSCYDSFDWMKKFGDPDFALHSALAQVWALMILETADEPVLGYDMPNYASELKRYVTDLKGVVDATNDESDASIDLSGLESAADTFVDVAQQFDIWTDNWLERVGPTLMETRETALQRVMHNARMVDFESALLDLPEEGEDRQGGLPGRTQFKHVVFGPQRWSGYEEAYFPGIRDGLEDKDWPRAQSQADLAAKLLNRAVSSLRDGSGG